MKHVTRSTCWIAELVGECENEDIVSDFPDTLFGVHAAECSVSSSGATATPPCVRTQNNNNEFLTDTDWAGGGVAAEWRDAVIYGHRAWREMDCIALCRDAGLGVNRGLEWVDRGYLHFFEHSKADSVR